MDKKEKKIKKKEKKIIKGKELFINIGRQRIIPSKRVLSCKGLTLNRKSQMATTLPGCTLFF